MNDDQFENKLTPAAKEVLDELVDDFRLRLLREANRNASDVTGEVREISIRDILDTLQKIETPKINKSKVLYQRILLLYSFLGIIVSMSGYLFPKISDTFFLGASEDRIALVGSLIAGASLILYIFLFQQKKSIGSFLFSIRENDSEKKDYSMRFVQKWREIELLSREVVSYYIGESKVNNMTIRDLLENLTKFNVFSQVETELFLKLLAKRNSVVHSDKVEMTSTEYQELNELANMIYKKLYFVQRDLFNS